MGFNRTPIDSSMTIQKAISQGGYYNTDGDWNNITILDEYPDKILRGRVEVLILDNGKLFMYMKDNGRYRIPGGGFDKGVLNKDQAFIETKEEAKLIISNIRYSGVTYTNIYDEVWSHEENEIPYHGNYNEVYVATYKGDYQGYIRKGLSDMELTNKGKFYELSEVEEILKEPHKQALMNVFGGIMTEGTYNDLSTTAYQFQDTLNNLHSKMNSYHCLQNVDIESNDGGYVFAQYNIENEKDSNEVKRFVHWCNDTIKATSYTGYVEEPETYSKSGFLYVKEQVEEFTPFIIDESCTDFFNEAASNMRAGKYPVFIVNSHIGTGPGKVITTFLHSTYAHSSIGFDVALENLYSFNRNGFIKESLSYFKSFNMNAPIQVSCIFVKKGDMDKIKKRVDKLWSNKDYTKYGYKNIINVLFNRPIETTANSLSMICSQFVTWVLSAADIELLDKPNNLTTPKDISALPNPKMYLLFEGKVKDYDKKKINNIFKKIKEKSELVKSD